MVQPFRSVDFSILVPEGQRTIWYNGQAFLSGRHSWLHLPPTCCPAGQTLILNVAGHMSVPPPELHTSAIFARVSVPAMPNAGSPCSCWNFTRYRCVWPPKNPDGNESARSNWSARNCCNSVTWPLVVASFMPRVSVMVRFGQKDAVVPVSSVGGCCTMMAAANSGTMDIPHIVVSVASNVCFIRFLSYL
jgi:hypothetical protein